MAAGTAPADDTTDLFASFTRTAGKTAGVLYDGLRTLVGGQPRRWVEVSDSRVHIEVRGLHGPAAKNAEEELRRELSGLTGVRRVEINGVLGLVIVTVKPDAVPTETLVDTVAAIEDRYELPTGERVGPRVLPGDRRSVLGEAVTLGAYVVGAGVAVGSRLLPTRPSAKLGKALVSWASSTPAARGALESLVGQPVAERLLRGGSVATHVLAKEWVGLALEAGQRFIRVREAQARHDSWLELEAELVDRHGSHDAAGIPPIARDAPMARERSERTANLVGLLGPAGFAGALLSAGGYQRAVALLSASTPKAARYATESFAATLSRRLCERGVVVIDPAALRRLHRIGTVVLDAELLRTDRLTVGEVHPLDGEPGNELALRAHELIHTGGRDGWALADPADVPALPAKARAWAPARAGQVRTLLHRSRPVALVSVVPVLDPLAEALVEACSTAGKVILAGKEPELDTRLKVDDVVAGGTHLAESVRRLQAGGHGVALVSARQRAALAAADLGIGVRGRFQEEPWGAAVICGPQLTHACVLLAAIADAKTTSARAVQLTAGGAVIATAGAVTGQPATASRRASLPVNLTALAGMMIGATSGAAAARRPGPVAADRTPWHALSPEAVLARLRSTMGGLSEDDAARREVVPESTQDGTRDGLVPASVRELDTPLTPTLATGAGLSAALGSMIDATLIAATLAVNALLGGAERVRGDRALRELVDASAVEVRVRRKGQVVTTRSERLVPGDVLELTAGDAVPADCRILKSRGLEIDESSLTGESMLVSKGVEPTAAAAVAERSSMLYRGTVIAAGRARAAVVAVGESTEVGRTSRINGRPDSVGVAARLQSLSTVTLPLSIGAGAILFVSDMLRRRPLNQAIGRGVGLAVAAIPEGLPFVATTAELAAARRLSRRGALVRNPSTVEALGRVDVLCFDKTGTLTEGRIALRQISDGCHSADLAEATDSLREVLAAAVRASPRPKPNRPLAHPTDRAILGGADRIGVAPVEGAPDWDKVAELPFEPSRGYHAVLGRAVDGQRVTVKGAPEIVLERCAKWWRDEEEHDFDEAALNKVNQEVERLAAHGYRVLAVAERPASNRADLEDERINSLRLLGLLALADPVRPTAAEAVRQLNGAGVEVIMVTGDHPSTSEAIGAELSLINGRGVMSGPELDELDDDELTERIPSVAVFARASPEQKARIVRALQRAGRTVAVTGDGANDAPAIRLAEVGIALGERATPAAREAADVIVTDDRIETITDAVVEGRAMWAAVRDGVSILVGGNLGEIAFTMGVGLLGGESLNVRQLLLVNLLTDAIPAIAVATRRPPRRTAAELLAEGPETSLAGALTKDVIVRAAATSTAATAAWLAARLTGTRACASSTALVALVATQLGQTIMVRDRTALVLLSSAGAFAVLVAAVQVPGLNRFFGSTALMPHHWAIALGAAATTTGIVFVIDRLPATIGRIQRRVLRQDT
jgi:cation-transporting ATPase I